MQTLALEITKKEAGGSSLECAVPWRQRGRRAANEYITWLCDPLTEATKIQV